MKRLVVVATAIVVVVVVTTAIIVLVCIAVVVPVVVSSIKVVPVWSSVLIRHAEFLGSEGVNCDSVINAF